MTEEDIRKWFDEISEYLTAENLTLIGADKILIVTRQVLIINNI